jgi:hypothetical protein
MTSTTTWTSRLPANQVFESASLGLRSGSKRRQAWVTEAGIAAFVRRNASLYARGMAVRIDRHPLFPQIEVALKGLTETWARVGVSLEARPQTRLH